MAKTITFEGKPYTFPNDATDAEIQSALQNYTASPEMSKVIEAIPGEAQRQLVNTLAGGVQAVGDITGSQALKEQAAGVKREVAADTVTERPQNMNIVQEGVLQGGASALTQLPAMGVGAAARIGGMALPSIFSATTTAMGAQTGLSKYGDERMAGFGPGRSALHALIEGLIEKYTEYMPLKDLQTNNILWKEARNYLGKEFLGEQIATLGQDINAKLSDQPDMTLGDYLRDALVTAIATPVASVGQVALAKAGELGARALTPGSADTGVPQVPPSVPPAPNAGTTTVSPAPVIAEPVPASSSSSGAVVAPPPQTPVETPKPQTTVRMYFVSEQTDAVEVSPDQRQALVNLQPGEPLKYVDVPFDQLQAMQAEVPDKTQNMYAGTTVIPLPRNASLAWKTAPFTEPVIPAKAASDEPVYTEGVEAPIQRKSTAALPTLGSRINVEGVKASQILFPDAIAKSLWDYGSALTRYETTTKPADTSRLNILRDRAKEKTGLNDVEVADQAQRYVHGVVITGLQEGKASTYSAPTVEVAIKAQKAREQTITQGYATQVKNGQVAISADLPYGDPWIKTMHTYLQAWVKTFSPQMRIVILGVQEGTQTRARTWYEAGTHYVYIPREQNKVLALYVLAHEFGHMIVSQHFNDPKYVAVKDKLIQEYTQLLTRSSIGNVNQFVRGFTSPIDIISGDLNPAQSAQSFINENRASITIDEWLADQMVRYMHTNQSHLKVPEAKGFWKPLFTQLKEFFEKVVQKFAPTQTYTNWLESLRMEDSQAAASMMTAPPSPRIDKSVNLEPNQQYEYTTRILERLPKKPSIKKVTIYGETARPDVRKEERELIGRILHDMPGESVDAQLFKERVLGEVVPLTLVETPTYSAYGINNIGYKLQGTHRVSYSTHIWEARGLDYTSPHFTNDSLHYWAHARGFVDFTALDERFREAKGWNIIELQSDLEQHMDQPLTEEERASYTRLANNYAKDTDVVDIAFNELKQDTLDGFQHFILQRPITENVRIFGDYLAGQINALLASKLMSEDRRSVDPSIYNTVYKELQSRRDHLVELEEDVRARLRQATAEVPGALPARWWELVLRHEVTWAAREGYPMVRMASADTIAKVEGWSVGYAVTVPSIVGRTSSVETIHPPQGPLILTGELNGESYPETSSIRWYAHGKYSSGGGSVWVDVGQLDRDIKDEIGTYVTSPVTRDNIRTMYGDYQGIYNRYAKEITNFVKREFNAKPYTDIHGNTWWEWPTTHALATVPIVYYNTARATAETGGKVAKESGVPELPKAFVRFQGFLQNTLQLNQMAKILPDVVGIQRYRTAMRSLHALKAKLFEGPNDRIHEWHKIGRDQARRVEQALKDEQLSSSHWTALVQTEVDGRKVWVHTPTASFDKFMQERGIYKEGQDLFLGIKNDYLSTLSAMEEVVRRHTNEFFQENPLVLAQRVAKIDEEFRKLRETPYLPDMRFGKYSVQVRAGKPETIDGREIRVGELVYWEKFESERARNKRYEELKRTLKGHNVSASYDSDLVSTMRGLPQSVMEAVAEVLNSDPTTALTVEQTSALEQIAFDQTAAGKFAKYLGTPAKHIAGASKDMRRAYAAYHWKTANAIAKLNYFRALTGALNAVRADARKIRSEGGVSDAYDKLTEYMQRNFAYVMNPQHEYEQLRAFVSLWYLWGSAKTAVMNLTSVPVLTYPYLWARFGNLQSQAAILRAIKDVAQYWRDPNKVSPDKQRVLEKLKADGVTDQSFASMLASVSDGGVAFEKIIPAWEGLGAGQAVDVARRTAWRVTSLGMMPFRVIEQLNRQVTGLAAYDLMVAKTGKTLSSGDTHAYNFARDTVDYTQNEYGAWNRPALMQGKQSVFLLFFSFVQNMSFLMFGGDKSWWRALLVLGALAGLQGLPGMDNLIDMFNWAGRKLTGQNVDLRVDARALARDIGMNPDMVMHGISHNWLGLGWDTSTSVGSGRIIPGTDSIFGVGKFEDRFLHATSEVGGPVGSLMISFLQALADDNPSQLLRWDRALPPVLRNIEKTYLAASTDEWTNARGRPVAENPTVPELVGQSLGFSPTRRTERTEELRTVKDVVEFYKERRSNLMEMMWAAKRTHDSETMKDVRVAIADYNRGVPSPHLRISSDDISASMKSREQLDRETATMRSPQKRYRDIYRYIDELY